MAIILGLYLLHRKLSLLEITIYYVQICDKILKSEKIEPFDRKKAKDKYFMKKLDDDDDNNNNNNNNNNNGLLTDPLDGSSLLRYINYN